MKSTRNVKSPESDGLTKEVFGKFWDDIQITLVFSIRQAIEKKELNVSQRQAIIKLIEKKHQDKRHIKNWWLISLSSVDVKMISKTLSKKKKRGLTKPNISTAKKRISKIETLEKVEY